MAERRRSTVPRGVLAGISGVALVLAGTATTRLPRAAFGGEAVKVEKASPSAGVPDRESPGVPDVGSPGVPDVGSPGVPGVGSPGVPGVGSPGVPPTAGRSGRESPDPGPARPPEPGVPEHALAAPAKAALSTRFAPGSRCSGIVVTKRSEPEAVRPGDDFVWVVTISNPNPAELSRATLVERVSATPGVAFTITGSDPVADSTTGAAGAEPASVTFDDLGPIGPGRSETARIYIQVDPASTGGRFSGEALVQGDCEPERRAEGAVPVEGRAVVDLPVVQMVLGEATGREAAAASPAPAPGGMLARTGARGWAPAVAALLAASAGLRRLLRPRRGQPS